MSSFKCPYCEEDEEWCVCSDRPYDIDDDVAIDHFYDDAMDPEIQWPEDV